MLKNLPDEMKNYILSLFNVMWENSFFPDEWRQAVVLAFHKTGKDPSHPLNYRPIALTSCLCKLMEKLINNRLVSYLEHHKLLTNVQCGFRKTRSTIDHLIRLDTYIKKAFTSSLTTVGVFFDLEKAYDTTWRYGIMRDMYNMGLRGRLPIFIQEFLKNRKFRVNINGTLSQEYPQEAGVPQGSILSVTLFAIKINSIVEAIPPNVHASLFVDDLQISYSDSNMTEIERTLQKTINDLTKWANQNGFKFSPQKSCCMTFHPRPSYPLKPKLNMYNTPMPVKSSTKFLGLHWDPQLNWKTHISKLKASCTTGLNLLRTLSSRTYGADHHTLLQTYRLILRPKLDYGCIVYGSADQQSLKALDALHNEALRICSGAFRSSPVESIYVLMNEPSLADRRMDLICRNYYKNRCYLSNPSYSCIINRNLQLTFNNHNKNYRPLITRTKNALLTLNLSTQPILPSRSPTHYPWEIIRPNIDTELATPHVKSIPNFANIFKDYVQENYPDHQCIYTDGSKSDTGVGAAAVFGNTSRTASLTSDASVYSAELHALIMACHIIHQQNHKTKNYLICTDSLSATQGLNTLKPSNLLMGKLQTTFHALLLLKFNITVIWIPGHSGIPGNEIADEAARLASMKPPEFISIPYTDFFPSITKAILKEWTTRWNNINNHLCNIKKSPSKWKKIPLTRKEGVIINRLRLGHTLLTHSYLMDESTHGQRPICNKCKNSILTVAHLFTCPATEQERLTAFPNIQQRPIAIEQTLGDKADLTCTLHYLQLLNISNEI